MYRIILLTAICIFNIQIAFCQNNEIILIAAQESKLWGYIGTDGKFLIEPKYKEAQVFRDGRAAVKVGGKWGVINEKGVMLAEPVFDATALNYSEGLLAVQKNKLWGFLNLEGKLIIPLKYKFVGKFSEGLCSVMGEDEAKLAFINSKGEEVIPFNGNNYFYYQYRMPEFHNGKTLVFKANTEDYEVEAPEHFTVKYGKEKLSGALVFINTKGNAVPVINNIDLTQIVYFRKKAGLKEIPMRFREGLFVTNYYHPDSEELAAYILNSNLDTIKSIPDVPKIFDFFNGIATIEKNGKFGFVNTQGDVVLKPTLPAPCTPPMFIEGLFVWCKDKKYGFLNLDGEWVIEPKFDDAMPFHNGLAMVKQNGKAGIINKEGKWVVQPVFKNLLFTNCPCYD